MIYKNRKVEEARLKDKVAELKQYYEELIEDLPSQDNFLEKRLVRRGIEKNMELIADAIIDVALILISSSGFEKPTDSRESISVLEKHKIIDVELAQKLRTLISFQNLLVHRYGVIDQEKEYQSIREDHDDIRRFIKAIKNFLE